MHVLTRCRPPDGAGVALVLLLSLVSIEAGHASVLRIPQDYTSIHEGLMSTRVGDTVVVAAGICYESLTTWPAVHLRGEPGPIFDGSLASEFLARMSSEIDRTAIISGFVLPRSRSAAILLDRAAPIIRNDVMIGNRGPGVDCLQASPWIVNNVIAANGGSGIAGHPAVENNDADGSRGDMGTYGGRRVKPIPEASQQASPTSSRRPAVVSDSPQNSLSFQGLPGIIDIPTATMVPSGSVDVGYTVKSDFNIFPEIEDQRNFNFAVGLLPRVTLGGRGTWTSRRSSPRDISANLRLQLLEEGAWWPAMALGVNDIAGGSNHFESKYLVLSKSFFGRFRGTVGFGDGPDALEGLFAGAELALNRFVTLLGEYDTDDFNSGLRLFPLPKRLETYGLPRPTVDLIWQSGDGFSWGVSFRSVLGEAKFQAQREARAHKRFHRRFEPPETVASLQQSSEQLQQELIQLGLENVRVSVFHLELGTTVIVEYENRRYNRDELHGLGLVLGLTATRVPAVVTHMRVIVKEVNTPVLQFTTAVDDYLAFINDEISEHIFSRRVQVTQQVQRPAETARPMAATDPSNRSWLRTDVILRPKIETLILYEFGIADIRSGLLMDSFMQLFPGTVVNVRASFPVLTTSSSFLPQRDAQVDRVLLHQTLRLPLGRVSRIATGLTQFSVGRFSEQDVGIANETALMFLDGVLFFKGTLARVGSSGTDLDRWVALANGRIRYPPLDLTLSLTAGRFLDGDKGVATDLSRFHGNTEIGVFFRHSDSGSLAGIRIALPLTPARDLKPMRFRPRLPERFAYEQRTTVLTDRNLTRHDIGRSLDTGHEIERVYWNRGRMYPAYIRRHLDALKQAVRRWLDA